MKQVITIETLRSGQPRPYADSEYEYLISFQIERSYGPDKGKLFPQTRLTVERASSLVREACGFLTKDDPKANWASEGVFRFFATAAFTD